MKYDRHFVEHGGRVVLLVDSLHHVSPASHPAGSLAVFQARRAAVVEEPDIRHWVVILLGQPGRLH